MVDNNTLVTREGDILLDFITVPEGKTKNISDNPLKYALVMLNVNKKLLLVFSRIRKQWELPGGRIEEGEKPKTCAIRELFEESGQVVEDIKPIGLIKRYVKRYDKTVFGEVYSGSLIELQHFRENQEISKIMLWDFISDIGVKDESIEFILKKLVL